jgi:hypothetical protein
LPLYCPFCHVRETERVSAIDENEKQVVLVMFDCPFSMKLDVSEIESDVKAQQFLNEWREKEGDRWLDSIGPILREREEKNIARYLSSNLAAS